MGITSLPPTLDEVPVAARVPETFGSFAAAIGVGATCVTIGELVALAGGDRSADRLKAFGIAFAVAALCFGWEIAVRLRRTTLVFAGNDVGLYRSGKLDQVIVRSQMTWYQLRVVNSLREVVLFGVFALVGGCGAVVMPLHADGTLTLAVVGSLVGGGLGLGGSIWSRWMCRHYIVPRGRGRETVVLPKSALARVGQQAAGEGFGLFHR